MSCHVVAIIGNGNLPHLPLATACKGLRISKNKGHPLNSPLNSTQDWHLGCIWFVEMKKTWFARAWAILMELQFFWQKSIRENPELLITFFDSVLWQPFFFLIDGHPPPTSQWHHVWGAKAEVCLQMSFGWIPLIMTLATMDNCSVPCFRPSFPKLSSKTTGNCTKLSSYPVPYPIVQTLSSGLDRTIHSMSKLHCPPRQWRILMAEPGILLFYRRLKLYKP